MLINIIGTKPNDQFHKTWPESSKTPNMYRFEIPKLKCMKCENKNKKKGKRVLLVFGERNLAKRMIKNNKNLRWSQVRIREREKSLETFEKKKVSLKRSRSVLKKKKLDSRYSINRKTVSINPNRKRLT